MIYIDIVSIHEGTLHNGIVIEIGTNTFLEKKVLFLHLILLILLQAVAFRLHLSFSRLYLQLSWLPAQNFVEILLVSFISSFFFLFFSLYNSFCIAGLLEFAFLASTQLAPSEEDLDDFSFLHLLFAILLSLFFLKVIKGFKPIFNHMLSPLSSQKFWHFCPLPPELFYPSD